MAISDPFGTTYEGTRQALGSYGQALQQTAGAFAAKKEEENKRKASLDMLKTMGLFEDTPPDIKDWQKEFEKQSGMKIANVKGIQGQEVDPNTMEGINKIFDFMGYKKPASKGFTFNAEKAAKMGAGVEFPGTGVSLKPPTTGITMSLQDQVNVNQLVDQWKKEGKLPKDAQVSWNAKTGKPEIKSGGGFGAAYVRFAEERGKSLADQAEQTGKIFPIMESEGRTKTVGLDELGKKGIDTDALLRDYTTIKQKARTMGTGQLMRFETAASSLDSGLTQLDMLNDEYVRSDLLPTISNKIKITVDKETGDRTFNVDPKGLTEDEQKLAIRYVSQLNFAKDQLALVFSGGYAPQEWAYKMATENLNPYYGTGGTRASIDQIRKEIGYRTNAVNSWANNKSPTEQSMATQVAQTAGVAPKMDEDKISAYMKKYPNRSREEIIRAMRK